MSSKEVLAVLQAAGFDVKAAASSVDEADIARAFGEAAATATRPPRRRRAGPARRGRADAAGARRRRSGDRRPTPRRAEPQAQRPDPRRGEARPRPTRGGRQGESGGAVPAGGAGAW